MKKIIFFGDSITDSNRDYHASIGEEKQLGDGFAQQIHGDLFLDYGFSFQVINKGINGDTIKNLNERVKKDVINYNPDLVFIMIGINDVWRHYDSNFKLIDYIDIETFKNEYEKLIKKIKQQNINIMISSAYFLDTNENLRKKLNEYNKATELLCEEFSIPYLDIQQKFDTYLSQHSSYTLSSDRVHMNYIGNRLIAKYIYDFIKENERILI